MRYSEDVLQPGWQRAGKPVSAETPVAVGLVVEDPTSGFCGAIVRWENGLVVLDDIADFSARLVVNRVSMKMESERIGTLIEGIRKQL